MIAGLLLIHKKNEILLFIIPNGSRRCQAKWKTSSLTSHTCPQCQVARSTIHPSMDHGSPRIGLGVRLPGQPAHHLGCLGTLDFLSGAGIPGQPDIFQGCLGLGLWHHATSLTSCHSWTSQTWMLMLGCQDDQVFVRESRFCLLNLAAGSTSCPFQSVLNLHWNAGVSSC